MKENILKRLQKYTTGGDTGKFASLGLKGIKPFLSGAASRMAGPLGLMFGSQNLNAAAGQYKPLDITMPSGDRSGDMVGFTSMIPTNNTPKVDMEAVNSQLQAAMAPKFQMGGAQPLPGGVMAPIPGSDAVEFMGNKHDESGMGSDSGIMVDQNTEVEGGETMDQVVMNKGGARDYFFSDHLKKGGMSYAQHHKNILQNGGGQQEVNMLAKMQEKAANRDPKQVAKLGGVVKYQEGGEDYLYDDDDINYVDVQTTGQTKDEYYNSFNDYNTNYKLVTSDDTKEYNKYLDSLDSQDRGAMSFDDWQASQNPSFLSKLKNMFKKNPKTDEEKLQDSLTKGAMPLAATIGLGSQLLPAFGAMLTKQKDLEKFSYTPGFTSPIVAGRVKGLTYEAPDQNAARAALARLYTGQNLALDRAGLGPGDQSNRQLNFSKSLNALSAIGAQESKDRLSAENLSKQSKQKAEMMNVQNELKAASVNAQMIQREADRRQAVDNANAQLKNMRSNEKIQNRMTILNNLAQGVATGAGDYMQYKASDRLARATGIYGIYERDKIKNMLLKNPEFQNMSEDDRNKEVLRIFNQLRN